METIIKMIFWAFAVAAAVVLVLTVLPILFPVLVVVLGLWLLLKLAAELFK